MSLFTIGMPFVFACPICESWGILNGYTEDDLVEDEDGAFPALGFFAEAFNCDECGLSLEDVEELKLAGIDTHYDRSDDIDRWFAEQGNPYDEYY